MTECTVCGTTKNAYGVCACMCGWKQSISAIPPRTDNPNEPVSIVVVNQPPSGSVRVNTNDWFTCEPPNARGDG